MFPGSMVAVLLCLNATGVAAQGVTADAVGSAIAQSGASEANESGGERQVLKFNDLGASLGMAAPSDYGGFAVNRNFLRGFANESALRNGYRDFGYLGIESEVSSEGVEVFKGPASALYGNGKPGGDINLLARQPDGVRRRDVQLGLDRYGYRSFKADVGGSVGADVTDLRSAAPDLTFRLGIGAEGGPSRREFDDYEGYGLASSLAWRISPQTRITLEADVLRGRDQVQPDRLPLAPLVAFSERRTLGEQSDRETASGNTWRVAAEHVFDERWRMRQAMFVQRSRSVHDATELDVYGLTGADLLSADGQAVRRVAERNHQQVRSEVSQTELYGSFDGGGAKHHVLAGVELGRYRVDETGARASLAALNLNAPVYGALPGSFAPVADQSSDSRTTVLYVQDRLRWNSQWQALLGLRAERVRAVSQNHLDTSTASVSSGDSRLVSPRLGLVYTPVERLSWFASWTQSSRPQLGKTSVGGSLLPPEEGQQIEAGLQWGSAQQGLLGTLSLYQLTKRNLATKDLVNPNFSLAGGERRSRGIELELRGELAPGLTLDGSAELLRARVLRDNDVEPGTELPGVAPWFISIWLTQAFAERWTLGWGVVGEGRRQATWTSNELVLPAYVTTDVSLAYRGPAWRVQATLGNALGRRALTSDGYAVRHVEPRAFNVTLSMGF